jgi:AcrR family transcriptional regulator
MGGLISRERRERARRAKGQRMAAIRDEAMRSFLKLPYIEVTLDSIGSRAGVKKGVASMYFGTKEELFLELLRNELEAWYVELEGSLEGLKRRLQRRGLARLLAGSLADRRGLIRLLSLAPVVLEQNVEIVEAYRFHRWQRERMEEVARALERSSRALASGRGMRLLHMVQLTGGAYQPLADPRGSLAVNLPDPDFEVFRIDLARELEDFTVRWLAAEE